MSTVEKLVSDALFRTVCSFGFEAVRREALLRLAVLESANIERSRHEPMRMADISTFRLEP